MKFIDKNFQEALNIMGNKNVYSYFCILKVFIESSLADRRHTFLSCVKNKKKKKSPLSLNKNIL
jgi:hypothetical protein